MSKLSYYGESTDFYTEDTIPNRIGRGSTLKEFLKMGEVNITNGQLRISESFEDILSTRVGSRFFNPSYGSKLHLLMFEQNDFVARDLAESYTIEALEKWEPRTRIDSVYVESEKKMITLTINYIIKDTGTPGSYVYTIERQVPPIE